MRFGRWMLPLVVVLLAFGFGNLEHGNRLYRDGRYAEAVEAYRAALEDGNDSPELHYNMGTALLRLGRYDEAERELRAALDGVEPEVRTRSSYNLGNRFLEAGRRAAKPEARSKLLEAAVAAYKQALRLDPADRDAKWNLEMALQEQQKSPQMPQPGGNQQRRPNQDPQQGGGGAGGAAGPSSPSNSGDEPRPASDPRALTREQAARILSAAEQDERELFGKKLRKGRRETPVARDW